MRGAVLLSLLLGLGIWQAVVTLTGVPRFILPGPGRVAVTLWESRALIAELLAQLPSQPQAYSATSHQSSCYENCQPIKHKRKRKSKQQN